MTQTPVSPPRTEHPPVTRPRPGSAWRGWIIFAGVMLLLIGSLQAIEGLVAIFSRGFYLVSPAGLVVNVDYTAWGWVHLAVAAVNVSAGIGILAVRTWARVWGIVVVSVSVIVNIGFISADPAWTAILIALDVIVIYALTVHWSEAKRGSL